MQLTKTRRQRRTFRASLQHQGAPNYSAAANTFRVSRAVCDSTAVKPQTMHRSVKRPSTVDDRRHVIYRLNMQIKLRRQTRRGAERVIRTSAKHSPANTRPPTTVAFVCGPITRTPRSLYIWLPSSEWVGPLHYIIRRRFRHRKLLYHFSAYAVQAVVLYCTTAENDRKPQIYREDDEGTVSTAIKNINLLRPSARQPQPKY